MGWGRALFLGNVGNQLDIEDVRESIQRMKYSFKEVARVDNAQDDDIENLRRENEELKLYLGSLIRLLVAKGILNEAETGAIVDGIEN